MIDIADVHSELNLPYWQDNVNFSGHLSGTTSSWKAKNLNLSTTEFTSEVHINKSLNRYDLELQSLELLPLFYEGLAPHIFPSAALETIKKYLVYITEFTGDITLENKDITINRLNALSKQGELFVEGRKCKDEWLIEGVILEWDPAILASIATHYSFISTESLATKRVHFLFNDALKDQKITLSLASNNQGNSKTISDPEINLDLRRKKVPVPTKVYLILVLVFRHLLINLY